MVCHHLHSWEGGDAVLGPQTDSSSDSHQGGLKDEHPCWLIILRVPCCDVVDKQPQRVSLETPNFTVCCNDLRGVVPGAWRLL